MIRRFYLLICAMCGIAAVIRLVALAAEPGDPPRPIAPERSISVKRALSQSATLRFDKTPLRDLAGALAKQYQIDVVLDQVALKEQNVSEDLPISFQLEGVSLGDGLRLLLRRYDLGFLVLDDEVLQITTESIEKGHTTFQVYEVRDLVGYGKSSVNGGGGADFDSLIETITSCISPASWDSSGGPGPISPVLGCLVIPQSDEQHEQIAALLQALRKVQQAGLAGCEPVRLGFPDTATAAGIEARLEKIQEIHFPSGTLSSLTAWLRELGIPTIIDENARPQAENDQKFAGLDLTQAPLDWALGQILSEQDLGFYVRGDGLVIASQEIANGRLECVVYSLGGLSEQADDRFRSELDRLANAAFNSRSNSGKPQSAHPQTGTIGFVPDANALVALETHEAQLVVGKLLAGFQANVTPVPSTPAVEVPIIKIYRMSINVGGSTVDASEADAQKYVAVIRNLIEPKSWTKGTGYIAALPGAIVVRQSPQMQAEIQKLLARMGSDGQGGGLQGGGFGGGGAFNLLPDLLKSSSRSAGRINPVPNAAANASK